MRKLLAVLGLIAAPVLFAAGSGWALNSSFDALSQSGTHKFYVWCTGADDYVDSAQGSDAREAQSKLAQRAGNNCWPVWQGLEG